MDKNRHSIRLPRFDYSQSGHYFVTVCADNRDCIFGNIVGAGSSRPLNNMCTRPMISESRPKMILNEMGKIVENVWKSLPKRFQIVLDEFQIMPNHIHMIIRVKSHGDIMGRENPAPTQPNMYGSGNPIPTIKKISLGQIIAYLKYESTKQINQYGVRAGIIPPNTIKKIFQRNYYEHIIRNETEYLKIKEYIQRNPIMWEKDENNPINNYCTGGGPPALSIL